MPARLTQVSRNKLARCIRKLFFHELRKTTTQSVEFVKRTRFDDLSVSHDQDGVGLTNGRESVSDDERTAVFGDGLKCLQEFGFGRAV